MATLLRRFFLAGAALAGMATPLLAATEGDDYSVSVSPYQLFGLPITNAMVTSWVISAIIIVVIRIMVGKPKMIPSKGQAIVENLINTLAEVFEPIVGRRMLPKVFPLLLALFLFILINNWSGLLPGVGSFGFYDEHEHLIYWFRPGNADLNMTLALALVCMGAWLYFILRYAGIGVIVQDLFGNKASKDDVPVAVYYGLSVLFVFVGLIEVVSIIFRPVSLSFRLFGNVYGGESLLTSMTGLTKVIAPVPFYILELLIGFVQALVFSLLVAVYIGLICNHGDDHDHEHKQASAH